MFALVKFLKKRQLVVEDFTLSNLAAITHLGEGYFDEAAPGTPSYEDWKEICPFIDVWLEVREDELRYVANILPTLSWRSGRIGVRLIYEPNDVVNCSKSLYLHTSWRAQDQTRLNYGL